MRDGHRITYLQTRQKLLVVRLSFCVLLPQFEIDVLDFHISRSGASNVQNNSAILGLDNTFLDHVTHIRHIGAEFYAVCVEVGYLSQQLPQMF